LEESAIMGGVYAERPAPGLACIWVHVIEGPTRILPDACSDLIWRAGEGAWLAGPDTTATLTELPDGTVLVGARFAPGAGGPALGRPLEAVRDQDVPLPGLVDPGLEPAEALRELTAAALRLTRAGPADRAVLEAARRLAADPRRRVPALADELGLSERQLRRRCLAAAGHTPKTLQRVLRLQRVVRAMDAGERDLARLAAEHGFADQAHLTGECTDLAGMPPARLAATRSGGAGTRAAGTTSRRT
jgi:AraC-like DNA-binding protein